MNNEKSDIVIGDNDEDSQYTSSLDSGEEEKETTTERAKRKAAGEAAKQNSDDEEEDKEDDERWQQWCVRALELNREMLKVAAEVKAGAAPTLVDAAATGVVAAIS